MATTVVLKNIVLSPTASQPDRRLVQFADALGNITEEREFGSLADLLEWARSPDMSRELVQQICVGYTAARSADLSNLASTRDKSFTFDLSAQQPIRVQ